MTEQETARLKSIENDRKVSKMIADHGTRHYNQFPNGRDFMAFKRSAESRESREKYRANFDLVFPNSPGAGI